MGVRDLHNYLTPWSEEGPLVYLDQVEGILQDFSPNPAHMSYSTKQGGRKARYSQEQGLSCSR